MGIGDGEGELGGGDHLVGDLLGGDLDRDLCRLLFLRCSQYRSLVWCLLSSTSLASILLCLCREDSPSRRRLYSCRGSVILSWSSISHSLDRVRSRSRLSQCSLSLSRARSRSLLSFICLSAFVRTSIILVRSMFPTGGQCSNLLYSCVLPQLNDYKVTFTKYISYLLIFLPNHLMWVGSQCGMLGLYIVYSILHILLLFSNYQGVHSCIHTDITIAIVFGTLLQDKVAQALFNCTAIFIM